MNTIRDAIQRILYKITLKSLPRVTIRGYYSQNGQDRFISENLLPGLRNGVFVDVGANDGETFSNSLYFEESLGWRGIAIEPIVHTYQKCAARRTCTVLNLGVANFNGTTEFIELAGHTEMLSGIPEFMEPSHLERIEKERIEHGGDKRTITIQCQKLQTILDKHNVEKVDYLSIDTEGSEIEILRSIDLKRTPVSVISIENTYRTPLFKSYLSQYQYALVALAGKDEIYLKRAQH